MSNDYDLVILGGGTGGYVAAIRAAQLGMRVAVVEKAKLGGTCLHDGCIPSKALLRTAELHRQFKEASVFGLEVGSVNIQLEKAQARKNKIVDTLHQGVINLLKKSKIDVFYGTGRILGPSIFSPMSGTISVEHGNGEENTMLVSKNVLIATGSSPNNLPGLSVDGEHILYSDHALQMDVLPKSIIIVGGGVIGIEWASMLQDLGVQVTVIENKSTILAEEDKDVRHEVQQQLQARGVTFLVDTVIDINTVHVNNNEVLLKAKRDEETIELQADKMLLSVGRKANIDKIGLQNTEIELTDGVISTNEMYQTKESHIYAIGDCIGGMQLAHMASAEGITAVEHMAGKQPEALKRINIPACIYAYPEVGRVGLTEEEAITEGYDVKVGRFPFQGIGKAHIYGDAQGFAKIITDKVSEDILGVHLVGAQVTDMISEASLAKLLNATAWEISKTIHPHPSLSEVFQESALAVDGLQIHG